MKLRDSDSLNRYIHEMTRYMSYDNAKKAKEDFIEIMEEKLGKEAEENEIKNYLEKIGSPYSISSQYEDRANLFAKGKNYELYNKMLQILFIVIVFSNIISYFMGFYNNSNAVSIMKVVVAQMIIVFISLTLAFFIAEKIKYSRIIYGEIEGFSINDLYSESPKRVKASLAVLIIVYSVLILVSITPLKLKGINGLYTLLIAIFFLNILRDVTKLSESRYSKVVLALMFISDVMSILIMSFYFKGFFINNAMLKKLFILLMLSSIYDLSFAVYETVKLKNSKRV